MLIDTFIDSVQIKFFQQYMTYEICRITTCTGENSSSIIVVDNEAKQSLSNQSLIQRLLPMSPNYSPVWIGLKKLYSYLMILNP